MCMDIREYRDGHMRIDIHFDTCTDMRMGKCVGVRVGMCIDMRMRIVCLCMMQPSETAPKTSPYLFEKKTRTFIKRDQR